ncbi:MAG: hypothetical protein ABIK65_04590 [Candidatus Eisenbacteria bacterium]
MSSEVVGGAGGLEPEVCGVLGSVIGEGVHFQVLPDSFHGVELGSVGGEELYADLVLAVEEFAEEVRPVDVQAIPEKHDRAREMSLEFPEKGDEVRSVYVLVRQESKVEAHSPAARGDRNRPDRRDLFVGTRALVEDRGLSNRSPGASEMGSHQKPALVQEDEARSQARSVFFILGHSSFTQRWISASFRSRARRSGFWGLKPRTWRRRAT